MYTPYFRVICYIFLVSIFSKNFSSILIKELNMFNLISVPFGTLTKLSIS